MQRNTIAMVAWILASAVPPLSARADTAPPDARLESVTTLIERSTAARHVEDSGSAEATAKHEEAREHLRAARELLSAGDDEEARRTIYLATRTMLEAVQLADRDSVVNEIKREDFENRLASVDALLDAHRRIGTELGKKRTVDGLRAAVSREIERSRALLEQQRLDDARAVLDDSYVAVKTALEHLRGGKTLVRTLSFASAEEEYVYELDRNDSHKILVKVLLEEKMQDAGIREMVERYVRDAASIREKGERRASEGNHAEAIALLEASTAELIKAIRSAGIYVPG